MIPTLKCSRCQRTLPQREFSRKEMTGSRTKGLYRSGRGFSYWCKACHRNAERDRNNARRIQRTDAAVHGVLDLCVRRIKVLEARVADLENELAAGRKKVSASSAHPQNLTAVDDRCLKMASGQPVCE